MSLSNNDLASIRSIIREENELIADKLEALENDIKDIYDMISALQKSKSALFTQSDDTAKERLLSLHEGLVAVAKELGVTLPKV